MSLTLASVNDQPPPPLIPRWLRPTSSSAILELPTAPITLASSPKGDVTWQAFTAEESAQCEEAWQNLSEEERRQAEDDSLDNQSSPNSAEDYDDEEDDTVGVSIAKDKLFEVDVRRWSVSIQNFLTPVSCVIADMSRKASSYLLENECSGD